MDEIGPQTLSPVSNRRTEAAKRPRGVSYALTRDGAAFATLLRDMQRHAGLSTRSVARKLGIEPNSINQYLYKKRGRGGTSTLKWFLRYAEACGCKVYITFPGESHAKQVDLDGVVAPGPMIGIGAPDV